MNIKKWDRSKLGFFISVVGLLVSLFFNYEQYRNNDLVKKRVKTTFATINEKAYKIHKYLEEAKEKKEPINIDIINSYKDSIIYEVKIKFYDIFETKLEEYEKKSF